jgi:MmyB-like transcription regulator ligand binding domain
MLDAMSGAPAFVRNARLDKLAANALGRALYAPMFESPAQPTNTARFAFLDPRSTEFYADWDDVANQVVSILRSEAGSKSEEALNLLASWAATESTAKSSTLLR